LHDKVTFPVALPVREYFAQRSFVGASAGEGRPKRGIRRARRSAPRARVRLRTVSPAPGGAEALARKRAAATRKPSLCTSGGAGRAGGNRRIRRRAYAACLAEYDRRRSQSHSNARNHNFPAPLTPTIGRDDVIALISKSLTEHRLVTILGPGGIGKTTVALEVSRRSLPGFAHGACFVDFSPLADSHLVPSALASALGISVLSHEPLAGLLACLRGKEKLLLLDTCEHVVDAVASLAEKLLTGLPGLRVLVTSREALRTGGEWVHRLPSLALPAESGALTAAEALAFPSVQLFVQRATATLDQFALGDADAPVVAHICRFLDGIPLAIELAAARVDELGLQEIAARLGDAFSILTHGRRTALPRHQTLAATLSWSYGLLSSDEQVLLRRLAVFRGPFTSEAASIVSESEPGARRHSVATLSSLFMKSLLCAATVADVALYRMLDTTRAFAAGQLAHSGELEMISRRHASYVCDALRDAEGSLCPLGETGNSAERSPRRLPRCGLRSLCWKSMDAESKPR
jgi:predicted ATPase